MFNHNYPCVSRRSNRALRRRTNTMQRQRDEARSTVREALRARDGARAERDKARQDAKTKARRNVTITVQEWVDYLGRVYLDAKRRLETWEKLSLVEILSIRDWVNCVGNYKVTFALAATAAGQDPLAAQASMLALIEHRVGVRSGANVGQKCAGSGG